ncbi:hypothetical protein K1719_046602 [Acacia pycnantha]|nr:hypothetical protein K1719_046602 [Acacia pycnantha]
MTQPLRHLEELLEELVAISRVSKGKQKFNIDLTPYRNNGLASHAERGFLFIVLPLLFFQGSEFNMTP